MSMLGIEVVGNLEGTSTSERRDHYVIVSVNGQEVAKSDKKPRQPAPTWEWPETRQLSVSIYRRPHRTRSNQYPLPCISLFQPSSTINIKIYRESRTHIAWAKHRVGRHTGKVVELLDNGEPNFCIHFYRKLICIDATIDLKDKAGAGIISGAKIKINLSLVPEPEGTFKSYMETVDADVSRLQNALDNASTPALVLDGALQLTKNIIDIVAGVRRSYFILFYIIVTENLCN
jgi:hypothetical protein